jgi:hypothetical protein
VLVFALRIAADDPSKLLAAFTAESQRQFSANKRAMIYQTLLLQSPAWALLSGIPWSGIANGLEIVGFFLTLKVLWDVRQLRSSYLFKARIPELTKRIGEAASRIAESLNDYESTLQDTQVTVGELEVALRSLVGKTSGRAKAAAKESLRKVKAFSRIQSEATLRAIYLDLRKLEVEINEVRQDAEWER